MAESAGEKTLAPTPKRLREAAKDGDVLRSRDLGVAVATVAGAALLDGAGPWLFSTMEQAMRKGLTWDRTALDDFSPGQLMLALGALAMPPILVFGGVMALAAFAAQLGPTGPGRFNFGSMAPKGSRLSPMSGFGRMFGAQGWIEVGKGILKIGLLGGIAYGWVRGRLRGLAGLGAAPLATQLAYGWSAMTALLFALTGGLVVIALLDFPIQWLRRRRRLRMSIQEMKDENKDDNGSPEAKMRQRQRQRAMAMASMAGAMKNAQFVVTNPTHFAVALVWDPDLAPAPVVLCKGRGEKALAIRELAAENEIPCLEYPALARSVYWTTQENQVIREELYIAVAGVLAFVFSLKRGEARPAPTIDVPADVRYDADGDPDPEDRAEVPETPA